MKTRSTYKRRYKKNKSRKSFRRYYKRGGQQLNYSIPGTRPQRVEEYIPPSPIQEEQYQPSNQVITEQQYDFASDAGKKVTDTVNQFKSILNQATQQVKDTYKKAKDKTLEQLASVAQKAQTAAQNATEKIKNIQTSLSFK